MTASSLCGTPPVTRAREFPMRRLNARMWGHSRDRSDDLNRSDSPPVGLGGCGRPIDPGQRVPIYSHDGGWRPGALATCGHALLCDYCSPRFWAASSDRFRVQFEDWESGGGRLLHIRLAVPHTTNDTLKGLLDGLRDAFRTLRHSHAWKDAGVVDWVRVIHVRWHPRHGWHPHYHVTAYVKPGYETRFERSLDELQAAFRDGVLRAGFKRASKRNGLFGRFFASGLRALYAWDHRGDEAEPSYEPVHTGELDGPSYEPDHDPSLSLLQIAENALNDDQQAWRLWEEAGYALKGKQVVLASRMLNELWKAHQADQPEEPETVDLEPVLLVDSKVWERARRHGCTQMGLSIGFTMGPGALEDYWSAALKVDLQVVRSRHGPPELVLASSS